MARLIGETHDLVFDRRAVARSAAADAPRVHRRPIEAGADDLVRCLGRVRDVTGDLRLNDTLAGKGERKRWIVAVLDLEPIVVDGARIEARAGSRLQAADAKAQLDQLLTDPCRREVSGPTGGVVLVA